jgi:hypothetical protein
LKPGLLKYEAEAPHVRCYEARNRCRGVTLVLYTAEVFVSWCLNPRISHSCGVSSAFHMLVHGTCLFLCHAFPTWPQVIARGVQVGTMQPTQIRMLPLGICEMSKADTRKRATPYHIHMLPLFNRRDWKELILKYVRI